jgi:hypothetical protein
MTTLERISFYQNRRDEIPNQELARELAENEDIAGIREIVENLNNPNKNIQSDCIKVLYEIGYIHPDLVAPYAKDFLILLHARENRMIWGGMIALACIAELDCEILFKNVESIIQATKEGTLITQVWGVKTLARVASKSLKYKQEITPVLMEMLATCLPRDIPTHLESILPAIHPDDKPEILKIIEPGFIEMTPAQKSRLQKILKRI